MKILCVEQDRARLRQLRREAKEIVPGARITVCRNPCNAVTLARTKGCDILLTGTCFDGLDLDGIMLAKQIQQINPSVNIIFITDHADTTMACDAREIGANAFLLRPYEKQRLARAIEEPRFGLIGSMPIYAALGSTKKRSFQCEKR